MNTRPAWVSPPEHPPLHSTTTIHLWRIQINTHLPDLTPLEARLSEDERMRANRFLSQTIRNTYIVVRGLLRSLIGAYLHVEPCQIQFEYSAYGKPSLRGLKGWPPLHFNISHSGDLAVFAFVLDHRIGVDVEYINPQTDYEDVAKSALSVSEQTALSQLPLAQRRTAFFNAWTRKEAFIKAHGSGLAYPLDQFDVSLDPDHPAALLATRPNAEEAVRWSLLAFDPQLEYAGALVVDGQNMTLNHWEISPGEI